MADTLKRRKRSAADRRVGGNIFGLLLVLAASLALFFYGYRALTTSDLLWFNSAFDATPRQLTIIDHGQRTQISPLDPRFIDLVNAFNASISDGYHNTSTGFSQETWKLLDREALLVEATYAEPVKLHGKYEPSKQLLMLVSGNVHTTQVLFSHDANGWVPIPVVVDNIEPIKSALSRYGFHD